MGEAILVRRRGLSTGRPSGFKCIADCVRREVRGSVMPLYPRAEDIASLLAVILRVRVSISPSTVKYNDCYEGAASCVATLRNGWHNGFEFWRDVILGKVKGLLCHFLSISDIRDRSGNMTITVIGRH